RQRRSTGGLDKNPLRARNQFVGLQNLVVGYFVDVTSRFLERVSGTQPACRIANADRRGNSIRICNRTTIDDWRGPGGLETEHPRKSIGPLRAVIFLVPFPVGGDVAGIAYG